MDDARSPSAPSEPPLLIDAERAAAMIGIGTRTLWSLTDADEIPHVRIRRRVLYPVEELRRWIESRQRGGR